MIEKFIIKFKCVFNLDSVNIFEASGRRCLFLRTLLHFTFSRLKLQNDYYTCYADEAQFLLKLNIFSLSFLLSSSSHHFEVRVTSAIKCVWTLPRFLFSNWFQIVFLSWCEIENLKWNEKIVRERRNRFEML